MTERAVSAESRQKTAALLTGLWQRNLPLIAHRMAILERAAVGPLSEELRIEAIDVAHKLAGSLGMFGFHQGTEIARELELVLELVLEAPSPDTARLAALTAQLRAILLPETGNEV